MLQSVNNPPAMQETTCNSGNVSSIPGLGRSPGEGKGYLLQYSGLENAMDSIIPGVTKSWTQLSNFQCSCLGNPVDRGAWQPTVHGLARAGHDLATKLPSYATSQVRHAHRPCLFNTHQNSVQLLFFLRLFSHGPFLKSLLNLFPYCFCFMFWFFGYESCGTLALWPGIKPTPPALEG